MRLIFLFLVVSVGSSGADNGDWKKQRHQFYPLPEHARLIVVPSLERHITFNPSDASDRARLLHQLSAKAEHEDDDDDQNVPLDALTGKNEQRRKPFKDHSRRRYHRHRRVRLDCKCVNFVGCLMGGGHVASGWQCPGITDVCCSSASGFHYLRTRLFETVSSPRPVGRSNRRARKIRIRARPSFSRETVSYSEGSLGKQSPTSLVGQQALYAANFIEDSEDYTCGVSRHVQRRILGGQDAGYGQFPWTAHIKIIGPNIDKECGGTLVHRRWILTAGHCTQYCIDVPGCEQEVPQELLRYVVSLGEYDQLLREKYPAEQYPVDAVARHPKYANVMRERLVDGIIESEPRYDVAMLRLARDANLTPSISPICLPSPGTPTPAGTLATVVGWGRIGPWNGDPHSNVLQAATVPILSDEQCLLETGLSNGEDQVCAGGISATACPGDSGGALQVQDTEERWTVVGVVSNGPSVCGVQPVVFHRVAKTMQWINRVIEEMRPQEALP